MANCYELKRYTDKVAEKEAEAESAASAAADAKKEHGGAAARADPPAHASFKMDMGFGLHIGWSARSLTGARLPAHPHARAHALSRPWIGDSHTNTHAACARAHTHTKRPGFKPPGRCRPKPLALFG